MKMLSDFQAGATVKYHGEPCIVLEHRKDGTLLMVLEQIEHTFGSGIGVSAATVGMVGLSSLQVHSQTNTTQHTMVMRATRRCRLILRARRHLRE